MQQILQAAINTVGVGYPKDGAGGSWIKNEPIASDRLISIAPAANSQKLVAFINGKATSRAPIWSGRMKLTMANIRPIPAKKIMIVPWAEKTCWNILELIMP